MAKVIQNEQNIVAEPWWAKGKVAYIGLGIGLLWWVITALLRQYVVEPTACRDLSTATACINSMNVSGNVATILVALLGMYLLVRYAQSRPVVIALSSAAVLWGLGGLADGLVWYAALIGAVLLYGLSYGLFTLVARIRLPIVSILVALALVVAVRLLIAL